MSTRIGGGGSPPSPGLIFRAALASCDATLITLRTAQEGIKLTKIRSDQLEVIVEGDPDGLGTLSFLGMYESVPAGEIGLRLTFHIGAENATPRTLARACHVDRGSLTSWR